MKICPNCMKQYDDAVDVCEDDGTPLRTFRDQASRMIGQVLDGRWAIEAKIAEGGMGEVYRARQVTMERVVAIKLIRSSLSDSEEFVARFFREANILATIHHPHFVTIYDYGQADNEVLYIAMEYLRGMSLGQRLETSRLGLTEIVKVGAQICAALDVAHQNQVVHRDLKPDNVFLVDVPDDIFVKVLDFGIAKQLDSDGTPVTRTGQLFGTPEYMSPEQCENHDELDQRSDLYSLGVILYELLTGRLPYDAESAIKLMVEKISREALPVDGHGIEVPEPLADVVMSLLRMNPNERPQSARDAREQLEAAFDWLREHPAAVDAFSEAHLKADEHPEQGTRRFDSSALDGKRAKAQKDLLRSRQIVWDEEDDIPFSLPTPSSAFGAGSRRPVVLAIVMLLVFAGGAFALPSVRGAIFGPEPEPIPLGPTDQDRSRALDRGLASVNEAHETAAKAPVLEVATMVAEDVRFDAAVFAASLPDSAEPAAAAAAKPRGTAKKQAEADTTSILSFRTRSSIERRIKRFENRLVNCYEARANPEDSGAIGFEFRIDPEGKVDHFKITQNDFDDGVGSCAEGQVRKWKFRKGKLGSGYDTHARTVRFRRD